MGIKDQVTGKAKQAAGEVTDSAEMRREGQKEEQKGEAREEAARQEERAEQLDRET